jgi:hypothetical protein
MERQNWLEYLSQRDFFVALDRKTRSGANFLFEGNFPGERCTLRSNPTADHSNN